jgi:hypothetical protein
MGVHCSCMGPRPDPTTGLMFRGRTHDILVEAGDRGSPRCRPSARPQCRRGIKCTRGLEDLSSLLASFGAHDAPLVTVIHVFSFVVRSSRIFIRRHEDTLLRSIYDRVPIKHEPGDYDSPYFKILLLLQAHLLRLPLSSELAADLAIVLERRTCPRCPANNPPRHASQYIQYNHKSWSTSTPFHTAITPETAGSTAAPSCAATKKAQAGSPKPCVGLSSSCAWIGSRAAGCAGARRTGAWRACAARGRVPGKRARRIWRIEQNVARLGAHAMRWYGCSLSPRHLLVHIIPLCIDLNRSGSDAKRCGCQWCAVRSAARSRGRVQKDLIALNTQVLFCVRR